MSRLKPSHIPDRIVLANSFESGKGFHFMVIAAYSLLITSRSPDSLVAVAIEKLGFPMSQSPQ
jgi:hypothetical protein